MAGYKWIGMKVDKFWQYLLLDAKISILFDGTVLPIEERYQNEESVQQGIAGGVIVEITGKELDDLKVRIL